MKTQSLSPAVTSCLLGCLLVVPAVATGVEFEPATGWSGHLFPSYIIATATQKPADADEDDSSAEGDDDDTDEVEVLGDERGLLGVTVEAEEDDQDVTVTITCDTIMEPSVISCSLAEKGKSYLINPTIKYKYDQLGRHFQTGPVVVAFKVESGDDTEEKSEVLTLRTINDCPYIVAKDGKWTSVRFMYAAYVNEQHPFVDKILREALDTGIVDSFTGYQAKDKKEVYRQAYALWRTLSNRDVRYSSITKTVAISDTVGSQHVRFIDESINNRQANCVDGSALLASLLRKINVEPMLVHVPGHCYLAFFLDDDGKELTALETTIIGSAIEGDAVVVRGLENVVDEDAQAENSWKTFAAAIARGTANLKKFDKEFKDPDNYNYKLISIAAARKSGILPIGFLSKQKFTDALKDTEE